MQRNVPAEKASAWRSVTTPHPGRCPPSPHEEEHAGGNHQPEAEIDQVHGPAGRSAPHHQRRDRQGVRRLVHQRRQQNAQPCGPQCPDRSSKSAATALASATPPTSEWTASPKAAEPQEKASPAEKGECAAKVARSCDGP